MKNPFLLPSLCLLIVLQLLSCKKDDEPTPPPSGMTPTDLTAAMEDILDDTAVPGFALSIVKDNAIIFQQAFGYADTEAQKPYTNQTIQHIASASKTFVGAAVVKAIEQGYFTLDTDINDILPVDVINPKQPNASITVKHLVTHTSGLLDVPGIYLAENYYILPGEDISTLAASTLINELGIRQREGRSLEEFLAEYYLEDGDLYSLDNFAATAPGSSWSYSNIATGLTAYLIETATQQSFADYVKANVFQPLGMSSSTYDISEVDMNNMAHWYYDRDNAFPRYANDSYAEGSVFTNNIDFGQYLLDMMKGKQNLGGALFSASGYDMLFSDQLPAGLVPADFADNFGIFWIKAANKIQHGGNSFGVSTQLVFDKNAQAGYTLMTNLDASFDYTAYAEVSQRIDQAIQSFIQAN